MKNLYEKLYNGIGIAISNTLNEMAKDISYRDIDRKLWLSVASTCSRNKADEAENVKPSGPDKNDPVKMMQRYVIALIIMNKPCPRNISDIDKIKTYKLIGHRAIELGVTIKDIQYCYNNNTGGQKKLAKPAGTSTVVRADNTKTKPKIRKELNIFEKLTADIQPEQMKRLEGQSAYHDYSLGNIPEIVMQCSGKIISYLKSQIKKNNYNLAAFGESLKKDFLPGLEIINGALGKQYKTILKFDYYPTEDDHYRYILSDTENRYYYHYYSRFNEYEQTLSASQGEWFLKNVEHISKRYIKKPVNMLKTDMAYSIFENVIWPYLKYKQEMEYSNNALVADKVLEKYNMTNISNYWNWFCQNVERIIKENKHKNIPIYYYDWSGKIEYAYYSDKNNKCMIELYLQSDNSDTGDCDSLYNLIHCGNSYSFRYVDKNAMEYVNDPDDAIYTCKVNNLEKMAKQAFDNIRELILKGILI